MLKRSILTALLACLALALTAGSAAARSSGALVFSQSTVSAGVEEGGLYAARNGRFNRLTENPADSQPAFSPDGRMLAFVRGGDLYAMRADGSGQRALTGGPEVDGHPVFSANGRFILFERRAAAAGAPHNLFTIGAGGGRLRALTSSPADDHDASFSANGRVIVFVRGVAEAGGGEAADLFSIRPSGRRSTRLTRTARIDEFAPRYFAGGIVFSRGQSGEGPSAYADIYKMRRNGRKVRKLVAGAGSAYVEDVSPNGRLLLFRRDQGLWVKRIGPGKRGTRRARKLTNVADGSRTSAVFSADGRKVAAFVAVGTEESLSAIDVATRKKTTLAVGFSFAGGSPAKTIGPIIAWQPPPRARR